MTSDEQPRLNTPPFGSEAPQSPLGGYTAADFPAPAGVPLVTEMRPAAVAPKRGRGLGTVIAAAALAAGAGTPAEVVARVYAEVDRSLWPAAEQSVRAQLDYLALPSKGDHPVETPRTR